MQNKFLLDCQPMSIANALKKDRATEPGPEQQLSTLLKASGDPLRLEILRVLDRESFGVQELCTVFDIRQPAMSHHLKVLAKTGLVATRREGNSIYYRRHHQAPGHGWQDLWQQLLLAVDALPLRPELADRLNAVYRDRSNSSRQFFAENAHRLRGQQELIASYHQYAEPICELMAAAELPDCRLALEIGPGEGAFLAELSPQFQRVVAVDISDTMLNLAREFASAHSLENVDFLLGDSRSALHARLQPNCIVANMVLHHTPSPADMLMDIARLLAPGGSVFLADLCRHDQAWAREACGDLWLGFEPADISLWAGTAGLLEGRHLYLAQRNGFSVQIRQFNKSEDSAERPPKTTCTS